VLNIAQVDSSQDSRIVKL